MEHANARAARAGIVVAARATMYVCAWSCAAASYGKWVIVTPPPESTNAHVDEGTPVGVKAPAGSG